MTTSIAPSLESDRISLMLKLIALTFILLASSAQAFELIMIQAISESKKTFITRNGKRQGVVEGVTATFTAEDISILARAMTVTGGFTQWQIVNPEAIVPFEKGAVVTYYPATEYLWALAPEKERKKYIKSQLAEPRQSWVFKGAVTRGISETVSDAPVTTTTRGGIAGEIFYEKDFFYGFSWDLGFRYEREVVAYPGGSVITTRGLIIADIYYYFDQLRDLINGRIYVGGGMGYGQSNSTAVSLSQSGPVALVPSVKMGIDLPFNDDWSFLGDAGFESLQTKEAQEDGSKQSTSQTNFKFTFGLRRYF